MHPIGGGGAVEHVIMAEDFTLRRRRLGQSPLSCFFHFIKFALRSYFSMICGRCSVACERIWCIRRADRDMRHNHAGPRPKNHCCLTRSNAQERRWVES